MKILWFVTSGLEWNVWIPWTDCSVSCNTGTRFRLKLCAEDVASSGDCPYTLGSLHNITICKCCFSHTPDFPACREQL